MTEEENYLNCIAKWDEENIGIDGEIEVTDDDILSMTVGELIIINDMTEGEDNDGI